MSDFNTEKNDLQAIVEKSADGLMVVDHNGLIRFVNRTATVILDRREEQLLGRPFEYSIREEETLQMDIKRRNGKTGTGEMRAATIEWNQEKAYLISIRDITERIIYDRLKDEWIHNVSHELRTPLTSMRESMSLLYDGVLGQVNKEQKNFLSMCLRNADHLKRILNNLLDISKIEAKKIKLNKKKTDLAEVVQSAVGIFVPLIRNKNLEFKMTTPERPMDVYIDGDSIVQVINNLVDNALKFTEKGSISVSFLDQEKHIACVIADTGRGIAQEDLPKVFDKFQQFGKTAGPENKGTGLGLAISKEIIQLQAGTIAVKSVLDQGSTFIFSLPKYSVDLEVQDQIQNRLSGSKEPFILFYVHLQDLSEVEKSFQSTLLQKTVHQIRNTLEGSGKKTQCILLEENNALLLIENIQGNQFKPRKEILRIIKESFFGLGIEPELSFSYGMTFYPKDGQTPDILLDSCRRQLIEEKSERFSKYILIVDDEQELTEATKTLLQLFGYENIDTAGSGPMAFEKVQVKIPDLIILDMKMPGMSGYEVIGRLRESFETQDIPILIMSGYEVETGRFHEYISKKAILTISKPVDGDLLRKMVYYLL